MNNALKFYIDGQWLDAASGETLEVIDPSSEQAFIKIAVGNAEDVDKAVKAAYKAFPTFSQTGVAERLALLEEILRVYNLRYEDLVKAVSQEMGAPLHFARDAQVWSGRAHLESTISALKSFSFSEQHGTTRVVREAIGVCAPVSYTHLTLPTSEVV